MVATLSQLRLLLKELRRTELKYDDLLETSTVERQSGLSDAHNAPERRHSDIAELESRIPREQDEARLDKLLKIQESIPSKKAKLFKRVFNAGSKVAKQPKRFIWALRDSAKFDQALIDVAGLVGYLQEMLSQDQMALLVASAAEFKLMLLQVSANMSDMKALLWAEQLQRPSQTTGAVQSIDELDGETLVDGEGTFDSMRRAQPEKADPLWKSATRFSILMNRKDSEPPGSLLVSQQEVKLDEQQGFLLDDTRTSGKTIAGHNVWVEWKTFELKAVLTEDGRTTRVIPDDITKRVDRLAALLHEEKKPSEFCIPHCLGYFQDDANKRFGLIFEPPERTQAWPPQSLLSLYNARKISLGAKVRMAQELAQWLMYLHAVNWLHKGLRSANVLFFTEQDSLGLGQPYVSGFEYSRIARGEHTTPGISASDVERSMYVHPDYLGPKRSEGYMKTYDMYSLGVILLEIAYWQPIDHILVPHAQPARTPVNGDCDGASNVGRGDVEIPRKKRPTVSQIEKFRDRILAEPDILGRVVETMGDAYAKATRVCITGMADFGLSEDEDQTALEVGAYIQALFVEEVVDVLKGIRV